jgi:hypothetical protein
VLNVIALTPSFTMSTSKVFTFSFTYALNWFGEDWRNTRPCHCICPTVNGSVIWLLVNRISVMIAPQAALTKAASPSSDFSRAFTSMNTGITMTTSTNGTTSLWNFSS